jgi:hypothetical protein
VGGQEGGGEVITRLEYWRRELTAKKIELDDLPMILDEWDEAVGEAELASAARWGNCRRGCPPSYVDGAGYCSPACHVGAPRGEFVTCPDQPSAPKSAGSSRQG